MLELAHWLRGALGPGRVWDNDTQGQMPRVTKRGDLLGALWEDGTAHHQSPDRRWVGGPPLRGCAWAEGGA